MKKSLLSATIAAFAVPITATNPHPALGGYQPASNVIEHSQMVYDVADITQQVNLEDMTTARSIYAEGRYSCKGPTKEMARKFKAFVEQDTVDEKLRGQAFFDSFTGGTGPTGATEVLGPIPGAGRLSLPENFYDSHLEDAFAGTGDFAGVSLKMRQVFIKKGILGVLALYANYELESAINKANASNTDDASGAPHAWDEGWAFYYGSHPAGDGGKWSAWEFAYKRDFDYTNDVNGTTVATATKVTDEILPHFRQGLKGARTGDVPMMIEARNNIYRLLALTSIRAALKYAYKAQYDGTTASYSDEYHMEAWAYFLAAAGWIEQAKSGAAATVLSLLDFKKTEAQLDSNLYCAVKAALIPAYEPLGLDCEKVGVWKDLPASVSCSNLPSCPATVTLPQGLASYDFSTDSTAGSNVDCGYPLDGTTSTTTITSDGDTMSSAQSMATPLGLLLALAIASCGAFKL
eukprot:CAMPEP_0178411034 /NCGR_PEP_ID=MMETSP0689_2-20121128/21288_1 /TAXON_ID=160604 /ORGANISM="Amphidinium massartii, Strain CS-259" /LENGTH=462 /DNA_ID=CAMNT_0020032231 /DNA_START=78 /DNA_END=1466 /DNA_ORIENTATION=-